MISSHTLTLDNCFNFDFSVSICRGKFVSISLLSFSNHQSIPEITQSVVLQAAVLIQVFTASPEYKGFSLNSIRWYFWQNFHMLRPRQNGRHFPDDIFKGIFWNENVWVLNNISLRFVPRRPINNNPTLVQVMAWRRPGDKPLSEPMMVYLLTHICVTWLQWVKQHNFRVFGITMSYCQNDFLKPLIVKKGIKSQWSAKWTIEMQCFSCSND